jgi:hypothetical protein
LARHLLTAPSNWSRSISIQDPTGHSTRSQAVERFPVAQSRPENVRPLVTLKRAEIADRVALDLVRCYS